MWSDRDDYCCHRYEKCADDVFCAVWLQQFRLLSVATDVKNAIDDRFLREE